MKKTSLIAALICSALVILSGCKEAGDAFVGKWDRVEKKIPDKEDSIEITREEGVFHITLKHWSPFRGMRGDYVIDKVQAKAESSNVLAVIGGGLTIGSPTFSIENDSLHTAQGAEYTRIK